MVKIRAQRVAEQMKKEVADIIRHSVKDPRIGFVTVTRVEVAGDLQHAKIFVSVLGNSAEKQATMDALQRAVGFVRGEVARRLRMRVAPDVQFKLDESGEYSAHIESVIRQIHRDEETGEAPK
ncbi:ribosome-binding factor A [Alicyclobacillus contaminans]|uniref:30S ribosome-binding factor RbfA n=1 Tax=Alicyclobacillus contaminans TaxID=392016 RepID=UPI0003FAA84E|nr:30S ribosome-binding factor RbfA [Alicyclobacillus contaminans]GMA48992.1 ribosome-binding factor A [Alicyclobacillus contaminans]